MEDDDFDFLAEFDALLDQELIEKEFEESLEQELIEQEFESLLDEALDIDYDDEESYEFWDGVIDIPVDEGDEEDEY